MVTESRLRLPGVEKREGWTTKGHKETFERDENVLHLDCGSLAKTHWIVHFKQCGLL